MKTTTAYVGLLNPSLREERKQNCKKYYADNKDTMQWNYYVKHLGKETVDDYISKFGDDAAKPKLKELKSHRKPATFRNNCCCGILFEFKKKLIDK